MPKPSVSIPGAPADPAASPQASAETETAIDPRDAEIARLRGLITSQAGAADPMVQEFDGANTRRYKAESKHRHLTSAELDAQVRTGKAKLTDHHVLCKDGWYVNPIANAHANG